MRLNTMSKSFLATVMAMAGGQFVGACDGAAKDVPAAEVTETAGIHGELLATVQVSARHRVDFYDFGEGAVGAHEVVDIGDEVLLDKLTTKPTLADIFGVVKPGAEVPRSLFDAQTRADAYNRKFPRPAGAIDSPLPANTVDPAAATPASDDIGTHTSALTSCSADLLGDNWGAQWFLNNHCNEGCFRDCFTNVISSNWTTTKDWFKWKVMAADFNVKAHTVGEHNCSICPNWELKWDHDVQPRQISIHTMTSGYRWAASASSACRLHSAALRCD